MRKNNIFILSETFQLYNLSSVTYTTGESHISYAVRHNDARGWGAITNDVPKFYRN